MPTVERQASAERLLGLLQERCDSLEDGGTRDAVAGILDEIGAEMTFATLDRLSAFERMGTEPDLAADRALAIALSGWLQGPRRPART